MSGEYNDMDISNTTSTYTSAKIGVIRTFEFWIIFVSTTVSFEIMAIWITVALLKELLSPSSTKNVTSIQKTIKLLSALCASGTTLYFLAYILEEIVVQVFANEVCIPAKYLKIFLGNMIDSFIYAVLWMKQKSFYQNPSISHLTTPLLRMLSWISGIFPVMSPFASFALFVGVFEL